MRVGLISTTISVIVGILIGSVAVRCGGRGRIRLGFPFGRVRHADAGQRHDAANEQRGDGELDLAPRWRTFLAACKPRQGDDEQRECAGDDRADEEGRVTRVVQQLIDPEQEPFRSRVGRSASGEAAPGIGA